MRSVKSVKSLGTKIMVSYLVFIALLVAVGTVSLMSLGSLHSRVAAVNTRDLQPLAYLRDAQNSANSAVITGFAAAQTNNKEAAEPLAKRVPLYMAKAQKSLDLLVAAMPGELKTQAQDLVSTYQAFVKADQAYKAGAQSPDAKDLAARATALHVAVGEKFDRLTQSLLKDADAQRAAVWTEYRRAVALTILLIGSGLALALALGLGIRRSVRRRTSAVMGTLDQVAQGDLSQPAPVSGNDEIAQMATALNSGLAAMRSTIGEVGGSASRLVESASGLSSDADATSESVARASSAVDAVASSAELVTMTVGNVASSTGELGSSIREISSSAQEAARVAGQAVGVVEATNATIAQLGNSSEEIGNVIQVIQSIAAQTSLLALNATIEAARAGEAGRGFAVVAGEVKDLARETAEATDSVISRVQAIQQDTEGAVRAIAEIGEIIQQINQFQSSIAAAVEEQSVTTDSMGDSIREALRITQEIASTIRGVTDASQESTRSVSSTRALAGDVAAMGEQLRRAVSAFRV